MSWCFTCWIGMSWSFPLRSPRLFKDLEEDIKLLTDPAGGPVCLPASDQFPHRRLPTILRFVPDRLFPFQYLRRAGPGPGPLPDLEGEV